MSDPTHAEPEVAEALKRKAIAEAELAKKKANQDSRLADLATEEGKLAQKLKIAESQKAIAEAEQATRDATFPKATATPLEGKIETDEKSGYVAELVGFQAMERCAEKVAGEINKLTLKDEESQKAKILLVDSPNVVVGDMPVEQVRGQMSLIKTELTMQQARLTSLLPTAESPAEVAEPDVQAPAAGLAASAAGVSAAMGVASSIVGQFVDLIGLFRTDYTLKGREFTIPDQALASSIAGRITNADVYVLNLHRLSPSTEEGSLMSDCQALQTLRQQVDRTANDLMIRVVRPAAEEVATSSANVKNRQAELEAVDTDERKAAARARLDAAEERLALAASNHDWKQGVVSNWLAASAAINATLGVILAPSTDGTPPLMLQALAREQMNDASHLLYVNVASSGGETITKRTLIFKNSLSYAGGAAVSYKLCTKDGHLVASGTVTGLNQMRYNVAADSGALI